VFDPKTSNQPKPKAIVSPESTLPRTTAVSDTAAVQDQIRERAYQLYESRGGQDGQDQQDWLKAEQQILKQRR
jgi:hypothetical protein